jgi:Leucine-rich repeat (LRR) protein
MGVLYDNYEITNPMKKFTFVLLLALTFLFGKVEAATHVATNTADSSALVALYNATNGDHWLKKNNWLVPGSFVKDWERVTVDSITGRVVGLSLAANKLKCSTFPDSIIFLTALTSIDLSSNDITGVVPAAFWSNLTKLRSIYLNNNALSGSIPESIGNMTGLTDLIIHTNLFSGQLPNALWSLTSLEKIEINSCLFQGQIPGSIGNLKNLTSFCVGNNSFSGSIPSGLWTLSKLEKLDLSNGAFSGSIPSSIGNLTKLRILHLYNNQLLTGSLPEELFGILTLEELVASSCKFSGTISPKIANCKALTRLVLKSNSAFSGEILSYLVGLTKLVELDLSLNEFTGELPNNFGNLNKLVLLNLGVNQFSGELTASFWNLKDLTSLKINENNFSGTIPSSISNLSNLEVLYLNHNEFTGTFPSSVASLSKLTQCIFNNNFFDELPVLNFSSIMDKVNCKDNNFTFEDFERNIHLIDNANFTFDYESQNEFGVERFMSGTINYPHSMSITCGGTVNSYFWWKEVNGNNIDTKNTFTTYTIPNLALSDAGNYTVHVENAKVKNLTLVSRPIHLTVEENCIVSDLKGLADFYSQATGSGWTNKAGWANVGLATSLQSIYGVGADSCNVLSINLPQNNLKGDIDLIGELPTLQTLNLSNNDLNRELPVGLNALKDLEVLDLSNNGFDGGVDVQIKDLDSLRYLSLSNNNFSRDLSPELWLLDNLTHLDLSYNGFTGEIAGQNATIANLQQLILNNNQIEGSIPQEITMLFKLDTIALDTNMFSGEIPTNIDYLTKLKYLGLSQNLMSGVLPEGLWRLGNLEVLKLGENDFSGVIPNDIANLDKLKVLTLNDNNFTGELSEGISQFDSLERLELKNNSFESLPDLSKLANLKYISCENNKLTFEDFEKNVSLINDPEVTFTYAPQQRFGREYDTVAVEGSLFKLPIPCGGVYNTYKWFKDGKEISGPARSYIRVFSEITLSDAGSYHITVQNDTVKDLTLQSFPVTIRIYGKPTLRSPANESINLPLVQELCWNKSDWAESYSLQVATDANFDTLVVDESGITETCFTPAPLNWGTTYYWRVNGKMGEAVSSWSEVWSYTTQPEIPDCPVFYLPENDSTIAPVTITLKWLPGDDRTETYSLQVATEPEFTNIVRDVAGLTSTEYLLEGLEKSTNYYWRVRGSNFTGSSADRAECNQVWTFRTAPPIINVDPVNLVAIDGKHITVFTVRDIELFPDNVLVMYTKWGKKVFEKTGYANDFDMTELPAGTYYYILSIRTEVEKDKPAYKGFVEVIKN